MWEDLARQVNEEFPGSAFTPGQIENKWRTMERAWRRVKTASRQTGNGRQTCEYERELTEVLEKEHAANPTYLAGPGRIRRLTDAGEAAETGTAEGPSLGDAPGDQQEERAEEGGQPQQPPHAGHAARRVRQDHTRALIQQTIATIQEAEANRQRRHEERLAARRQAEEEKKRRHQHLIAALEKGTTKIAAAIEARRVSHPYM